MKVIYRLAIWLLQPVLVANLFRSVVVEGVDNARANTTRVYCTRNLIHPSLLARIVSKALGEFKTDGDDHDDTRAKWKESTSTGFKLEIQIKPQTS